MPEADKQKIKIFCHKDTKAQVLVISDQLSVISFPLLFTFN